MLVRKELTYSASLVPVSICLDTLLTKEAIRVAIFISKSSIGSFEDSDDNIKNLAKNLCLSHNAVLIALNQLKERGHFIDFHPATNTTTPNNNSAARKKRFVYLMLDLNTGFTKIGLSKNPKFREKTLQSEKPTIRLLNKWEGTINDEKHLHKVFDNQRIRGEWFNLDGRDYSFINNYFNPAIK